MKPSHERRQLLVTGPSPAGKQDFLIQFDHLLWLAGGSAQLVLRFVPHQHILDAASLGAYSEQFKDMPADRLENLAAMLQEDFSNVLIPRFLHIELTGSIAHVTHCVVLEERQPRWDNPVLIARLKPL